VAWVPARNLHITLRFLGEQGEPALEQAFGGDAELTLEATEPHGVRAMLEFPARAQTA